MESQKLATFFQEPFFIQELVSNTKEDVLKELLVPLAEHGNVRNTGLILETLLKRETLGSTGIGKEVAVPHCRTSVVSDVKIIVGISPGGVPFDAIDGKKVKLFFLIAAPPQEENNEYLPVLGKLVELLRNSKTRKALRKCNDFQLFLDTIKGI